LDWEKAVHLVMIFLGVMLLFSPPIWVLGLALILGGVAWAVLH
jgi:hypothetical protein